MDTSEWGNNDGLYDIDDLDLEQYGLQYDNPSFLDTNKPDYSFWTGSELGFLNNAISFVSGTLKSEPEHESYSFAHPQYTSYIKEEPMQDVPHPNYIKVDASQQQTIYPSTPHTETHLTGKRKESEASSSDFVINIERHPPVEVRTRTPSEVRTFTVSAKVVGNLRKIPGAIMRIILYYERNSESDQEPVKKDILGGTKTVPVHSDGSVVFDNLTISESSTKHKEREFVLMFSLLRNDGFEVAKMPSKSFYAYSHKKVLQRRGSVKLRTLSKTWGRMSGGDQMHLIGSPFIQGPALSIIVRTQHGDMEVKNIEFFSDSVLFFIVPL
eukprot:TRINITY_DN7315_c0_g1_i1.p1 TRINITY_DN7315_c0_g1~~TRINITY_DN7315_c0_g1_i1.p1  ORF type:complete len:326 (+),score=60.18 TRINITY_DN7315_c0_g1_i1:114-1091(+)